MPKPVFRALILLAGVCAAVVAPAQKKKPEAINELIVKAQYVMVTTARGTSLTSKIPIEDLRAVGDAEGALKKWGHYIVVARPEAADIVIVVRRGRLVSITPGITIGRPPEAGPPEPDTKTGLGRTTDIEAGMPFDTFAVYDARANWPDTAPLWRKGQDHGLDPPDLPLFKAFRDAVDSAAKKKP